MSRIALIAVVALAACTPEPPQVSIVSEPHCTTAEDRTALARFIVDCGKAANPLSDEEGEDLIAQCEQSGVRAICPNHMHRKTFQRASYEWSVEEITKP